MTTDESMKFFEALKDKTTKKPELKVYDDFIQLLIKLNNRGLSATETIALESKLDELKLKSPDEYNKKHFRKVLNSFKEYLKKEFSLVSKGYYTAIGMSLGMCFGVAFGSLIEKTIGTSSGLVIGMLIGIVIGRTMDAKAEKEGNVL